MTPKRGTKVNYLGGYGTLVKDIGTRKLPPVNGTYVWAILDRVGEIYIIEHPYGFPKEHFLATGGFSKDFKSVRNIELNDGLLYAYAQPEELEIVK